MTGELLCEELTRARPLRVLTETAEEGGVFGHTASFLPILVKNADCPLGEIVSVRPTAVLDGALVCELCE